jgi:hypothetical protein
MRRVGRGRGDSLPNGASITEPAALTIYDFIGHENATTHGFPAYTFDDEHAITTHLELVARGRCARGSWDSVLVASCRSTMEAGSWSSTRTMSGSRPAD